MRNVHFRLPYVAQKRICVSSLFFFVLRRYAIRLEKLAPLFPLIRSKTKTDSDLFGSSRLQIPMKFRVEEGKPGEKICEAALKEKAMLIVLGSRGSGLIRRTVLGSVSHYVIHHTKIPVVLCPKDHL